MPAKAMMLGHEISGFQADERAGEERIRLRAARDGLRLETSRRLSDLGHGPTLY